MGLLFWLKINKLRLSYIRERTYNIEKLISTKRALIIYGPRRVGKTILLNDFLSKTKLKYKLDSGDNIKIQQILGSQDFTKIKDYALMDWKTEMT